MKRGPGAKRVTKKRPRGKNVKNLSEAHINRRGAGNPVVKDFAVVHSKLRRLEKQYNPKGEEMHFHAVHRPEAKLFAALLTLAREGLELVSKHRDYFLKHELYEDGMFWYGLFQMIRSAAVGVKVQQVQRRVPPDTVEELIRLMIDISEYSLARPGDIVKRNQEALAELLYTFEDARYFEAAKNRAKEIDADDVIECFNCTFVDWAIRTAKDAFARNRTRRVE